MVDLIGIMRVCIAHCAELETTEDCLTIYVDKECFWKCIKDLIKADKVKCNESR